MSDKRATDLTELTTVADGDFLYVVDVSDTTDSSAGSSRKAQAKNVRGWPQTSAESSAGVTPTNYQYEPGNVLRYGTNTTPGTTDMSTALQNACNSNSEVYIPEGTYLIGTEVTMSSGQHIRGAGPNASTLLGTSAGHTASSGLLYANSGSSSTFIEGISISDLGFDGDSTTHAFSEFQHLVSLNGVRNCTIHNCYFQDARGDGIYFGSGIVAGHERHNHNVTVSSCVFNGVSSENRNAISVIDGDGVVISNCHFYDWAKSTIPGAIDFEPDANAFAVIKNCIVDSCTFENIGGNIGCVSFDIDAATFTTQPENLVVSNCTFDDTAQDAIVCLFDNSLYSRNLNLNISNNVGRCARFLNAGGSVNKIYGLVMSGNVMETSLLSNFNFNAADDLRDASITGNSFIGAATNTGGFLIRSGDNITITGNTFNGFTNYVFLLGGTSANLDHVMIANNVDNGSTCFIQWNGGTFSNISVLDNDLDQSAAPFISTLPTDLVIRGNQGPDELVTTTNVIIAGESGKTFYLNAAGGFTSTLPPPHRGLRFTFIVKTAPTTAYIITTDSGANVLYGTYLDIVGEQVYFSAQDAINFVAATSVVGDRLEVESDGTNWYCKAFSGANGGITVSVT